MCVSRTTEEVFFSVLTGVYIREFTLRRSSTQRSREDFCVHFRVNTLLTLPFRGFLPAPDEERCLCNRSSVITKIFCGLCMQHTYTQNTNKKTQTMCILVNRTSYFTQLLPEKFFRKCLSSALTVSLPRGGDFFSSSSVLKIYIVKMK